MFCPKCGNQLPDGSAFCGKCGTRLAAPAGAGPSAGAGGRPTAGPTPSKAAVPNAAPPRPAAHPAAAKVPALAVAAAVLAAAAVALSLLPWLEVDPVVSAASALVGGAAWGCLLLWLVGAVLLIVGAVRIARSGRRGALVAGAAAMAVCAAAFCGLSGLLDGIASATALPLLCLAASVAAAVCALAAKRG